MADPARGREPISDARRTVAAIGILIMVFSGGCTLLFASILGETYGFASVILDPVFLIGVVPFAIGLMMTWGALRGRRGNESSKPPVARPPQDGTPSG